MQYLVGRASLKRGNTPTPASNWRSARATAQDHSKNIRATMMFAKVAPKQKLYGASCATQAMWRKLFGASYVAQYVWRK
eukprot:7334287-Pyramimonas_sp.AAC.1